MVYSFQEKKPLQISARRKPENGILDKLIPISFVPVQLSLWATLQRCGPTSKKQPDLQTSEFITETQSRRLLSEAMKLHVDI